MPLSPSSKACSGCGEVKPHSEFSRRSRTSEALMARCKPCRVAATSAWNAANPKKHRGHVRRWAERNPERLAAYQRELHLRRYGLTPEAWESLFESQGRACAGCRRTEPVGGRGWYIDHDHGCCDWSATSAPLCGRCVRGILCAPCNTALGMAQDSEDILLALIDYLRRTKC